MKGCLIFPLLALVLSACATSPAPAAAGVAIYLTRDPMSGRDILASELGRLALQPEPVIASDEIMYYSASTHELVVQPAAIERLAGLHVPVQGLGFVICQGRVPLMAGAFWTPISSLSFDGLTINVPFDTKETRLHLYGGYPMLDVVARSDPRDDPRLLEAFRQAGKLR